MEGVLLAGGICLGFSSMVLAYRWWIVAVIVGCPVAIWGSVFIVDDMQRRDDFMDGLGASIGAAMVAYAVVLAVIAISGLRRRNRPTIPEPILRAKPSEPRS